MVLELPSFSATGPLYCSASPRQPETAFLERLVPCIHGAVTDRESEELLISVEPTQRDSVEGDQVELPVADVHRLQLVATALSKSVVLAECESLVTDTFDQIEPLAAELQRHGRAGLNTKGLLRHIGQTLLTQHRMVGRVEVRDKPELLWDHSELETFYLRLEDELEISERHSILERKLELISRTAATVLELLHTRRGHRLEWYIVILIVVEIVLIVYDLFAHAS